MSRHNNVNDNGTVSFRNNNDNVRNTDVLRRDQNVERIAWQLVDKFKDDTWYKFYCKVAYTISEAKIWLNYEKATNGGKVKNPAGLFHYLCQKDMRAIERNTGIGSD